ncbi:unnamed protein product [Cylindrotheca closterium]|uniref:Uncharacterized protein n=1 Tax=Cylindrotheca closterium TaxID=2856 RepID=A0AAD2CLV3_9STRA|nr:unnamed protein product [Cylindrotheca closterium]
MLELFRAESASYGTQVYDECQTPILDSCDHFYLECLEKSHSCGDDEGYALGFGLGLCQHYPAPELFSVGLRAWYRELRRCLKFSLVETLDKADGMTCNDLEQFLTVDHYRDCFNQYNDGNSICGGDNYKDLLDVLRDLEFYFEKNQAFWDAFVRYANSCGLTTNEWRFYDIPIINIPTTFEDWPENINEFIFIGKVEISFKLLQPYFDLTTEQSEDIVDTVLWLLRVSIDFSSFEKITRFGETSISEDKTWTFKLLVVAQDEDAAERVAADVRAYFSSNLNGNDGVIVVPDYDDDDVDDAFVALSEYVEFLYAEKVNKTSCQEPSGKTCKFYSECLEEKFQCGDSGYPLAFGLHYCEVFLRNDPDFSEEGLVWAAKVRQCLQDALVETLDRDMSCEEVETFAFDSHPECYASTGYCFIPVSDWWNLFWAVEPNVQISGAFWSQVGQTIMLCGPKWVHAAEFLVMLGKLYSEMVAEDMKQSYVDTVLLLESLVSKGTEYIFRVAPIMNNNRRLASSPGTSLQMSDTINATAIVNDFITNYIFTMDDIDAMVLPGEVISPVDGTNTLSFNLFVVGLDKTTTDMVFSKVADLFESTSTVTVDGFNLELISATKFDYDFLEGTSSLSPTMEPTDRIQASIGPSTSSPTALITTDGLEGTSSLSPTMEPTDRIPASTGPSTSSPTALSTTDGVEAASLTPTMDVSGRPPETLCQPTVG